MKKKEYSYESITKKILDNKKLTRDEAQIFNAINQLVYLHVMRKCIKWFRPVSK